jgi:hypothetical protein
MEADASEGELTQKELQVRITNTRVVLGSYIIPLSVTPSCEVSATTSS